MEIDFLEFVHAETIIKAGHGDGGINLHPEHKPLQNARSSVKASTQHGYMKQGKKKMKQAKEMIKHVAHVSAHVDEEKGGSADLEDDRAVMHFTYRTVPDPQLVVTLEHLLGYENKIKNQENAAAKAVLAEKVDGKELQQHEAPAKNVHKTFAAIKKGFLEYLLDKVVDLVDEDLTGVLSYQQLYIALHLLFDRDSSLIDSKTMQSNSLRSSQRPFYFPHKSKLMSLYGSSVTKRDFHELYFNLLKPEVQIEQATKTFENEDVSETKLLEKLKDAHKGDGKHQTRKRVASTIFRLQHSQQAPRNSNFPKKISDEDLARAQWQQILRDRLEQITHKPLHRLLALGHDLLEDEQHEFFSTQVQRVPDSVRMFFHRIYIYFVLPFFVMLKSKGFKRFLGLMSIPIYYSGFVSAALFFLYDMKTSSVSIIEALLPAVINVVAAVRFVELEIENSAAERASARLRARVLNSKLALERFRLNIFGQSRHIDVQVDSMLPSIITNRGIKKSDPRAYKLISLGVPMILSLIHCVIPGLFRMQSTPKQPFFGATNMELYVVVSHIVVSFLAFIRIYRDLTVLVISYMDTLRAMTNLAVITQPQIAGSQGFDCFIDLEKYKNMLNWMKLRDGVLSIEKKKTSKAFIILAPVLLLTFALLVLMVARILFSNAASTIEIVTVLGAFDSVFLTIYVCVALLMVVLINTQIISEHPEAVRKKQWSLVQTSLQSIRETEEENNDMDTIELLNQVIQKLESEQSIEADSIKVFGVVLTSGHLNQIIAFLSAGVITVLVNLVRSAVEAVKNELPLPDIPLP